MNTFNVDFSDWVKDLVALFAFLLMILSAFTLLLIDHMPFEGIAVPLSLLSIGCTLISWAVFLDVMQVQS